MNTTSQTSSVESKNAIKVSKKFLTELRTSLRTQMGTLDKVASNRQIVDDVVNMMRGQMAVTGVDGTAHPIYFTGNRGEETYTWFDSEVAKRIQEDDRIVDKGRFVDACIVAYLYGSRALSVLAPSREIRPRALTEEAKADIAKVRSAMNVEKSTDSKFVPTTLAVTTPLA